MAANNPTSPSSASSPSQGSHKRSAEEDISELIRKAKASRYVQPPTKRQLDCNADALAIFEEELSCSICATIYHHPVTCLDCRHVFCGSCIVQWFDRSDRCPTCRQKVKEVQDNLGLSNLAKALLETHPGIGRPEGEVAELDELYIPGQEVEITQSYSDDEDEDETRQEYDGDLSERSSNSGEPPGTLWLPCPCCTTPNDYHFTCTEPILPPGPETGNGQRHDALTYRSHASCNWCNSSFPIVWEPGWNCSGCGDRWCGNLFTCPAKTSWIRQVQDHGQDLGRGFFFDRNGPRAARFSGNQTEKDNFDRWRTQADLGWREIGQLLINYMLEEKNGVPADRCTLLARDFACQECIEKACNSTFMAWWIWERERTGYIDNRARCWEGRNCRDQYSNESHAELLNHCCEPTPLHLRGNNNDSNDNPPPT